jgi:protein TonB
MFAESILETSWAQRSRRSWTTLTSFGLQAFVMGLLLLLPLITPVGLPFLKPLHPPIALAVPRGAPPAAPQPHPTAPAESNLRNGVLIMPHEIPRDIALIHETEAPAQGPVGPYVPGGMGNGDLRGIPSSLGTEVNPVVPAPPPPVVRRVRVSQMSPGSLIRRVQPVYPQLARSARIQGSVVLTAIISKEGTIENLRVIDGHPMLVKAAIEAVSQWRYKPYILNNDPVEVETQITVNFSLTGN